MHPNATPPYTLDTVNTLPYLGGVAERMGMGLTHAITGRATAGLSDHAPLSLLEDPMADPFLLKNDGGAQFTPHPEGQVPMVCVDFLDLGNRVRSFPGAEPKLTYSVALVFVSGEVNADGHLIEVSKEFTASMHEKASLRKFLEDWRGKSYTKDEVKQGIPADKLVGKACLLTVEHKESAKGRTYASVRGVAPLPKQIPAPHVEGYVRAPFWDERKKSYATEAAQFERDHQKQDHFPEPDDDGDIPF